MGKAEKGAHEKMVKISEEARQLARKIAVARKIDLYLYNGPISERGFASVVQVFNRSQKNALILLTTNGGSANAAYRIARWFQAMYDTYGLIIFSYCKSAGTLIATGAHDLIMSPVMGELGPLDVQLSKRDELWEQRSGLTLRSALNSLADRAENLFGRMMTSIKAGSEGAVRFRLASELAVQLTVGLLAPVYGQITPEGLGEDHQELLIAAEYAERLAAVGRNVKEGAIDHLVHDYPSHDFVIDAKEAENLFHRVQEPDKDLLQLASKLQDISLVPESEQVTAINLSKPDEQKADETKGKRGADATKRAAVADAETTRNSGTAEGSSSIG